MTFRLTLSLFLFVSFLFPTYLLQGQTDSAFIHQINTDTLLVPKIVQANELGAQGKVKDYALACDTVLMTIQEKYGEKNRVFIEWKINKAIALLYYGDYSNSNGHCEELVPLVTSVSGYHSEDMVNLLNLRGVLSRRQGQISAAKDFYEEAIKVGQEVMAPEDLIMGSLYNNLALVLEKTGNYYEALPLYKSSLENARLAVGEEDAEYAARLDNLTNLYWHLGKLDSLIYFRRKVVNIAERTLGPKHYLYSRYLFNLATEYQRLDMSKEALDLFNRSKEIFAAQLDTVQFEYADRQKCVAFALNRLGRYEEALQCLQIAIDINTALNDKENIRAAEYLTSLGSIHAAAGQSNEAIAAYKKAIQSFEDMEQTDVYWYPSALLALGNHYMEKGQFAKAKKQLELALAFFKIPARKEQAFYLEVLQPLAYSEAALGHEERALVLMDTIHFLRKEYHLPPLKYFSAKEQLGLVQDLSYWRQRFESYLDRASRPQKMVNIGFENSILSKELIRLNQGEVLSQLNQSDSPTLVADFKEWLQLKATLGEQYRIPLEDRISSFDSLLRKANVLESQLARTASSFRTAHETIDWKQIHAKLSAGEAILNITHYQGIDDRGGRTEEEYYVAYLLKSSHEVPIRIPLFEKSELSNIKAIRKLYSPSTSMGLNKLIWQNLAPHLEDISTIYYSPAGLFHRLNLGAIPVEGGEILADIFQIQMVSNLRAFKQGNTDQFKQTALIYGNIKYDPQGFSGSKLESSSIEENIGRTALEEVGINQYRSGDSQNWPQLPWTARETKNISEILDQNGLRVKVKEHFQATEESVKQLSGTSPRVLHFATHGYFFDDPSSNSKNGFRTSDHPLIRSGLILAGANAAWQGEALQQKKEDGILTAYEVSQLDLSQTELVVLSACDTGLGVIQGDEGVFGLQRAFKLAGVKNIIMSLWNVKDRQSMEFMTAFYQEWLEKNQDIPTAFQAAQRKLRTQYATPFNPFLWAGFVLVH